jgi:hypothetical protein
VGLTVKIRASGSGRLSQRRTTLQERPMTEENDAVSALDDWMDALRGELGLDLDDALPKTVLDLARVVAHTVDRPAAPVTAYFLGVAVGRGEPVAETAERIKRLAASWARH